MCADVWRLCEGVCGVCVEVCGGCVKGVWRRWVVGWVLWRVWRVCGGRVKRCGGFVLGVWSVREGSVEEMGSWVGSFECGCGRDDLVCWLKGM